MNLDLDYMDLDTALQLGISEENYYKYYGKKLREEKIDKELNNISSEKIVKISNEKEYLYEKKKVILLLILKSKLPLSSFNGLSDDEQIEKLIEHFKK